jgi:hypothetical protein
MKNGTRGVLVLFATAAAALGAPAPASAQVERVVVKVAEARCFS